MVAAARHKLLMTSHGPLQRRCLSPLNINQHQHDGQEKLTPDRLMQAKAFLDNGVISKDQFIEMTHGQSDYETNDDSQQLLKIFDKINAIEQHLLKLES